MWMANLLVAIIVLGCGIYQYLKGTVVKSFAMLAAAIFANIIAFNYFEVLARSLGGKDFIADYLGKNGSVGWLQTAAFLLLFGLSFIIFLTITEQLTAKKVDLGNWPERVGRVVFGGLAGLVIAGVLLVGLMLAPLASGKPYERFSVKDTAGSKPNKVLLNADGFVAGLFGKVSRVSFSGERSFSVVHANFLDQVALTGLYLEKDKSSLSLINEIALPNKIAAWPAPANMEYKEPEEDQAKEFKPISGKKLLLVRVGIRPLPKKNSNMLTMSQVRLVCKSAASGEARFSGTGENIHPVGFIKKDVLLKTPLSYRIDLGEKQFTTGDSGKVAWVDFAFPIPNDSEPVAVEVKRSSIVEIPESAIAKEALTPAMLKELNKNEVDAKD